MTGTEIDIISKTVISRDHRESVKHWKTSKDLEQVAGMKAYEWITNYNCMRVV